MSLLTEVKAILSTVSNVYLGSMPITPDSVVALYNSGGSSRDLSGSMIEEPTFQVRVRSTSYVTGEALCGTIKNLLHGYIGGKFLLIAQQGDTMDIGRDENNRQEWTINFRCYYNRG